MAQYATLKAAIDAVIKANGQKEITGTVLNEVLTSMVNSLGANYQLAGVATPSTNPGTPDQNVFYLAFEAGTYTNFNATVLSDGISILMWNGSWSSQTFYTIDATPTASSNNLVSSGAVFDAIKTDGSAYDVSAHFPTGGPNSDGKFTLEYILSNANTLIPAAWRKGGMSIRFVSSSDNNYIQARLTADEFTTDVTKWQGVDAVPTAGSKNLAESGGIFAKVSNSLELSFNSGYYLSLTDGSYRATSDATPAKYSATENYYSVVGWKNLAIHQNNIAVSLTYRIAFYKIDKSCISCTSVSGAENLYIAIPTDAAFLRISVNANSDVSPYIASIDFFATDYSPLFAMLFAENYTEKGTITYNGKNYISSYGVVWADGTEGTYTATNWSDTEQMYRGYEVTYGSSLKVVQSAVTVSSGRITNVPLKVISAIV